MTLFKHVNDFKLEYMDLDEFLNENEHPPDSDQEDRAPRQQQINHQQQQDYELVQPLPVPKDVNIAKPSMNQLVIIITI